MTEATWQILAIFRKGLATRDYVPNSTLDCRNRAGIPFMLSKGLGRSTGVAKLSDAVLLDERELVQPLV